MSPTFRNTGGTNNTTEARLNFYEGQGNTPTEVDRRARLRHSPNRRRLQDAYPRIELQGDGAVTEVQFDFDRDPDPNDWFTVTFRLESGETGLFFVRAWWRLDS